MIWEGKPSCCVVLLGIAGKIPGSERQRASRFRTAHVSCPDWHFDGAAQASIHYHWPLANHEDPMVSSSWINMIPWSHHEEKPWCVYFFWRFVDMFILGFFGFRTSLKAHSRRTCMGPEKIGSDCSCVCVCLFCEWKTPWNGWLLYENKAFCES